MRNVRMAGWIAAALMGGAVIAGGVVWDFVDSAGRGHSGAERIDAALTAGEWQTLAAQVELDVLAVAVPWEQAMYDAGLGRLDGARHATAALADVVEAARVRIQEPALDADDAAARTDAVAALAIMAEGLDRQLQALSSQAELGEVAQAYLAGGQPVLRGLEALRVRYPDGDHAPA